MKNLIIAVCGDESLHKVWMENADFDLFVVYYGDTANKYRGDGVLYDTCKGSKFLIVDKICERHAGFLNSYDAIAIPDDDLYISGGDWNHFFKLFHQYEMKIAQPSIAGWQSLILTSHNPNYIIRYTNWVEIMTPCFDQKTFQAVKHTFKENETNWGIEYIWTKILGNPDVGIGIIDDVVAIHTRPCFYGDTYQRNNNTFEKAIREVDELVIKYDIDRDIIEYGGVERTMQNYGNNGSEDKFFPANSKIFKELVTSLRKKRCKTFL